MAPYTGCMSNLTWKKEKMMGVTVTVAVTSHGKYVAMSSATSGAFCTYYPNTGASVPFPRMRTLALVLADANSRNLVKGA